MTILNEKTKNGYRVSAHSVDDAGKEVGLLSVVNINGRATQISLKFSSPEVAKCIATAIINDWEIEA
jgi:hypothetical protein